MSRNTSDADYEYDEDDDIATQFHIYQHHTEKMLMNMKFWCKHIYAMYIILLKDKQL